MGDDLIHDLERAAAYEAQAAPEAATAPDPRVDEAAREQDLQRLIDRIRIHRRVAAALRRRRTDDAAQDAAN